MISAVVQISRAIPLSLPSQAECGNSNSVQQTKCMYLYAIGRAWTPNTCVVCTLSVTSTLPELAVADRTGNMLDVCGRLAPLFR